jgi:glyceraldehyde 3-phosphate dehydrogenase
MKKIKIGLTGFGRIGRCISRIILSQPDMFELVVVNDINDDLNSLTYMLKYDSMHGILENDVKVGDGGFYFDNHFIKTYSKNQMDLIPWHEHDIDIIIGCTGSLKDVKNAKNCIQGSVKKVVFSDSPDDVDFTFVFGCNDKNYDPKEHNVISASICDVVGLAPVLKLIDEKYGIESGFLNTLHPVLFYQNILDGKSKTSAFPEKPWNSLVMGRSSLNALIPKDTSLIGALEKVIPTIKGKISGMSYRVPTDVVSTGIANIIVKNKTNKEEVLKLINDNVNFPYLGITEEALVSTDYKHNKYSSIVDLKWVEVRDETFIRVICWYDNEWGYSSRLIDILKHVYLTK